MLTNSYSAEFGKASGGVVNIITRSGTNELRGNVFEFFRNDSLNAKDHFEKFDVFGDAHRPGEGPVPADRSTAPPSAVRSQRDQTFFFLSAERLDTETNNFVTIDPAAAPPSSTRTGSRSRSWQRSVRVQLGQATWPRSTISGRRAHTLVLRAQLREPAQREHRAVRRHHRAQPRRRAGPQRLGARRVADRHPVRALDQRAARAVGARESGDQLPRSRTAADRATRIRRADRRSRSPAWPAWAGSASRRSRGRTSAISSRTRSASRRQHSAKAGFDFNYIDTATPRFRCTSAAATSSPPCPRFPALGIPTPISATPGVGGGISRRVRAGLRDAPAIPITTLRPLACSCRTIGASPRLNAQGRPALSAAVLADDSIHASRCREAALHLQLPQDTNNFGPRLLGAFDPRAMAARRCTRRGDLLRQPDLSHRADQQTASAGAPMACGRSSLRHPGVDRRLASARSPAPRAHRRRIRAS